jgi:hypothetical protein
MKILFDTNTVLDLLLDREPFVDPVAQLFSLVERGVPIPRHPATHSTVIRPAAGAKRRG